MCESTQEEMRICDHHRGLNRELLQSGSREHAGCTPHPAGSQGPRTSAVCTGQSACLPESAPRQPRQHRLPLPPVLKVKALREPQQASGSSGGAWRTSHERPAPTSTSDLSPCTGQGAGGRVGPHALSPWRLCREAAEAGDAIQAQDTGFCLPSCP